MTKNEVFNGNKDFDSMLKLFGTIYITVSHYPDLNTNLWLRWYSNPDEIVFHNFELPFAIFKVKLKKQKP